MLERYPNMVTLANTITKCGHYVTLYSQSVTVIPIVVVFAESYSSNYHVGSCASLFAIVS